MSLIRRLRRDRVRAPEAGQSTVEFALMIPVIMTFFFWVFQVNVFMLGYHQMAYASFAAARHHIVERGQSQEQEVVDAILTGKIYTSNVSGKPTFEHSTRIDGQWNVTDGAQVNHPGFQSLPYVRNLFNIKAEIPTHLGPDEYNLQIYSNNDRAKAGTNKRLTDNNIEDFD